MFTLTRDSHGSIALRYGENALPVESADLETLVQDQHLQLPTGSEIRIAPSLVSKAIESALLRIGRTLTEAEATKRSLLHLYELASRSPDSSRGAA